MAPELNSTNVTYIFRDSLFHDGEDTTQMVKVEGISLNVGFHPLRLDSHRQDIHDMLMELPDSFKQSSGGGMSFLAACHDRRGHQWTGMHRTMEELFLLGQAVGLAKCLLPRELWTVLPGSMPYYEVLDQEEDRAV